MSTYTIANQAGGDARTYRWTGSISAAAIRHADRIRRSTNMPPAFAGEWGDYAADEYETVLADREVAS